jgi:hypothetical protein
VLGFVQSNTSTSSGNGSTAESGTFSYNLNKITKVVEETQSPQHFIDNIKSRILWEEHLSETLESLDRMTLLELFWLYERIIVRDMYIEASEKDQKMSQEISNIR